MEQFEQEWESPRARTTYQRPPDQRAALGPTQRVPSTRGPEGQRPGETPPALPPPRRDDRGKAPMRETTRPGDKSRDRCYRCQGIRHHAIDCPHRSLAIGNGEPSEQEQPLLDVRNGALVQSGYRLPVLEQMSLLGLSLPSAEQACRGSL
ncbi:hypothetical protein Taro_038094, partial [Colocasia esculenta]|nr:hypothetical protein [Colocasia esculenta]